MASSSRKKRPARVFFVALLVTLLYFIIFPYPLGREIVVKPAWAVALPASGAASGAAAAASQATATFQLGGTFGYISGNGNLLRVERTLFRVTLAEAGYINYTRLGTDWLLQNRNGRRVLSFSGHGYPLLSGDGNRIFNIKTDLTGIIEMDKAGEALWDRDFPSMMTSISVRGQSLLVGLLNGTLLLLGRQGSPLFEYSPGESRIPVILGDAVSEDGTLLAAVSGIDPQYVTVLRRGGATFARLSKTSLSSDFRREVRMSFSPDSRFLAFEGERSAGLYDPASRRLSWVSLRGSVAGMSFPGRGQYAAIAARDGPLVELCIVAPFTAPILRESFPAHELYLGEVDGQLLVGIDGRLLRIDVEVL